MTKRISLENIESLISTAIAITGEDVTMLVYQLPGDYYAAEIRNDTNEVMTMATDADRLLTANGSSVAEALETLDALCAEDNLKNLDWQGG